MIQTTVLYDIYRQHRTVITDSRKTEPGCLFFALKGPRFNGNEFALQALESGAAYAVIDEDKYRVDDRFLLVEDVLTALQNLAHHHRQQLNTPVLAITGSNGKTTTKELVNAVLSSHYKTHCTRGNFNNHIGVPLTLLAVPDEVEIVVVEMGANHLGEIAALCQVALPTHGLITNIGKAHLEGFGDLEGVKKGKSELYRFLADNGGMAFVNGEESFLNELSGAVKYRLIYGRESNSMYPEEYVVRLVSTNPFVKASFADEDQPDIQIESHLVGEYNFNNIMTAVVIGLYFKVPGHQIKAAIENYQPQNNRSQLTTVGTNTFLMDAYNANPDSMKNALLNFAGMSPDRKIAILGDMLELGDHSHSEHQRMVDLVQELSLPEVWLVGTAFAKTDFPKGAFRQFDDVGKVQDWLRRHPLSDTLFLLKGSRGCQLEKILNGG